MCTADATKIDLDCIESFKQSSCFPYCMALHARGTGTQPMILHGASEWDSGVVMLNRHCGWGVELGDNSSATSSSTFTGSQNLVVLPQDQFGINMKTPLNSSCTYHPTASSMVPKTHTIEYQEYDSIDLTCVETNENTCQPFAFAGDIALVALPTVGGSGWTIQVQRIFGSQSNEFTIIPLPQLIPSSGPCSTPSDCGSYVDSCQGQTGCLAAIPYRLVNNPRNYVTNGH